MLSNELKEVRKYLIGKVRYSDSVLPIIWDAIEVVERDSRKTRQSQNATVAERDM